MSGKGKQMRRWAAAFVLVALSLASPGSGRVQTSTPTPLPLIVVPPTPTATSTSSTGFDNDHHRYVDPRFGWTLTWDPSIWPIAGYTTDPVSLADGVSTETGAVVLTTGTTEAGTALGVVFHNVTWTALQQAIVAQQGASTSEAPSAAFCFSGASAPFLQAGSSWHLAQDASGQVLHGVSVDGARAWAVLVSAKNSAEYIECRLAKPGADFVLVHAATDAMHFNSLVPLLQKLLASITVETSWSTPAP